MTRIARAPELDATPEATRAEGIALALMGARGSDALRLADAASWDHSQGAVMGRAAILEHRARLAAPEWVEVSQVVTQGRAGTVSGRMQRPGERPRIFCHVIRFTSPAATEIAQIVSFDHAG